jgi:hypothetical protein
VNIKPIFTGRIIRKSHLAGAVLAMFCGLVTSQAHAINVTYDFAGTCAEDCGPLGVLTTAVDTVTGTLELDLSEPTIAQLWDASNVLTYSFTYDNFTIDNTNSTLTNFDTGGDIPFTTTATAPFSIGDAALKATYDVDSSVYLLINVSGLNLLQDSLLCDGGSCQAVAAGSWTRTSVIPVPAAVWLFGSGFIGLIGVARRKKA